MMAFFDDMDEETLAALDRGEVIGRSSVAPPTSPPAASTSALKESDNEDQFDDWMDELDNDLLDKVDPRSS